MAFSINEIYSNINRGDGLASPSAFSVMITPPPFAGATQNAPRLIQFMADTAQLPGLTFETNYVKNLGYGPTFKLPHTPTYSDIDLTIMLDNNGIILKFFHLWMQNIININPEGTPSTSGYNGAKPFAVQYPSNYVTTITITLYNAESDTIVVYTLNNAYPLRIGQPGLDWGSTNSILRLPVTFTYKTWTSDLFHNNNQTLPDNLQTFNPFAQTITDESLYTPYQQTELTLTDILLNNSLNLINNNGISFNLYF